MIGGFPTLLSVWHPKGWMSKDNRYACNTESGCNHVTNQHVVQTNLPHDAFGKASWFEDHYPKEGKKVVVFIVVLREYW